MAFASPPPGLPPRPHHGLSTFREKMPGMLCGSFRGRKPLCDSNPHWCLWRGKRSGGGGCPKTPAVVVMSYESVGGVASEVFMDVMAPPPPSYAPPPKGVSKVAAIPCVDVAIQDANVEAPGANMGISSPNVVIQGAHKVISSANVAILGANGAIPCANKAILGANMSIPSADVAMPSTNVTIPPANVSIPSANVAALSANVTILSANGSIPSTNVVGTPPLVEESFLISGGARLSGHVHIGGAKNSALAILAATLCSEEEVRLQRVPDLVDVRRMLQVLASLGVCVRSSADQVVLDARALTHNSPCPETVKKLRAGFFVIGALLGRLGEAVVALPGGCNIGTRPVDLHLRGLQALGAKVEVRQDKVHAWCENGRKLRGGTFHLDFPSVGATETLMMAASLADGSTVLSNVAQEPEVVELARFLVSCGARIEGAGSSSLVIHGVKRLHTSDFTIIPDRIEAGTFLFSAAITRSTISMSPVIPCHLTAVVNKLKLMGCNICQLGSDTLWISSSGRLKGSNTRTQPYPGFPTDLQPQLMSLLTTCYGSSIIEETIFESRMGHVAELLKLGADIKLLRNKAIINGSNYESFLRGAAVRANDLRAGAALVVAGMGAHGMTRIEGISHIDRGYEGFDRKLCHLGAKIERIQDFS